MSQTPEDSPRPRRAPDAHSGPAGARPPSAPAPAAADLEVSSVDHRAYSEIAASDDFVELRRRFRRFVLPATIVFMVWYVLYVICNNWAREFMNLTVVGNINVALIFGLLQFVSTFAIAVVYSRVAGRRFDPIADRLRSRFDEQTGRTAEES